MNVFSQAILVKQAVRPHPVFQVLNFKGIETTKADPGPHRMKILVSDTKHTWQSKFPTYLSIYLPTYTSQ